MDAAGAAAGFGRADSDDVAFAGLAARRQLRQIHADGLTQAAAVFQHMQRGVPSLKRQVQRFIGPLAHAAAAARRAVTQAGLPQQTALFPTEAIAANPFRRHRRLRIRDTAGSRRNTVW